MLNIGDFDDPMGKYDNIDVSKYAIELTPIQCVYLQNLLPGNGYRFQPEEATKTQMQRRKNKKKKNAKSAHTDSVISNSDKLSSSERNNQDSVSMQSKKVPSTPSKAVAPSEPADSVKDSLSKGLGGNQDSVKQFIPSESADSSKNSQISLHF